MLRQKRLLFLLGLKSGRFRSQFEAGESVGWCHRHSQRMWERYRDFGLSAYLESGPKGGSRAKMSVDQDAALRSELDSDAYKDQRSIIGWVHETFGIRYSQSGMSEQLSSLGIKLKTGRPVNVRKDVEGEIAFKKTSKSS